MGFTLETRTEDREQPVMLKYLIKVRNHALGKLDGRVIFDFKHKLSIYVRY